MKWLKRVFCLHLNWRLKYKYHRVGLEMYECKHCGKTRLYPMNNPPINSPIDDNDNNV